MEIREALKLNKVIPVTLSGAQMPLTKNLPRALHGLPGVQAQTIDIRTFDADMKRLIGGITKFGVRPPPDPGKWPIVPETVSIPKGTFQIGSPAGEVQRRADEGPQHTVTIAESFAIGVYPVTRGQFAAFAESKKKHIFMGANVWRGNIWERVYNASWEKPGFLQEDTHPVVCVNSDDIEAYLKWLNEEKDPGKNYRLPTEAEWEYACRAGTDSPFWWGTTIDPGKANYNGTLLYEGGGIQGEYRQKTVPVHTFPQNPWGLYQMHGNVWERCADMWNEHRYQEKGGDSLPRAATKGQPERCVLRGGSWQSNPDELRSAYRGSGSREQRYSDRGFRLARTL